MAAEKKKPQLHIVDQEHHEDEDHGHHDPSHAHDEHEAAHDEPWLVSYADMMTLLFGFFVIMYSFAAAKNNDEETDLFRMKKEIATYFGGEYINPVDAVAEAMRKEVALHNLGGTVEVRVVGDSLELIMQSKVLFESGSADIIETQRPAIQALLQVLVEKKVDAYNLIVEGHTDDAPISTFRFRSNWDLSAARAATVAMLLQEKKYDMARMSVRAFGEFKPMLPNRDSSGRPIEDNMAKNRRIVLRLVAEKN